MNIGSIFENNETQAVCLPADTRFPKDIKQVSVRVVSNTCIIEPLNSAWDSFFHHTNEGVIDNFMAGQASLYHEEEFRPTLDKSRGDVR